MWQLNYGNVLLCQFLLLGSTYIIFFRSKIITGLEPQQTIMKETPADRLVIFVVDGLSAQSFFESGCSNIPNLSEIFLNQGQVGICRTRPTNQYTPVHMLFFSGFYENPLALFPNRAYDTIFNRSVLSYAWGSANLLQHFPDIHEAHVHYNDVPDIEKGSYKLDEWAFNGVQKFINSGTHKLNFSGGLVYFIHLMGLQESKGKQMYKHNLNYTQLGIWKTYKQFEQAYPDHRTAFLLISTCARCKENTPGAIETPFMLWGAGISNSNSSRGRSFIANKDNKRLPLHILEQIHLTPLMNALLGLSPPVNNQGQLPTGLINASHSFESQALMTNALQLLEQALHLLEQHDRGLFSRYLPRHWLTIRQLNNFIYTGNLLSHQKRFLTLKEYSANFMTVLLKCIDYYEDYYNISMVIATACSFAGWQCLLRSQQSESDATRLMGRPQSRIAFSLLRAFLIALLTFTQLQYTPVLIRCVLMLPIVIWMLVFKEHDRRPNLSSLYSSLLALCCIAGLFCRRLMSIFYLGFSFYNNRDFIAKRSLDSKVWMIVVCILTTISWMPSSLGYWHRNLLLTSFVLTFACQLLNGPMQDVYRKNLLLNGLILLVAIIHVLLSPHPWLLHIIARTYMVLMFYPRFKQKSFDNILFNLSTIYTLLCTSYEAIVIQLLAYELKMAFYSKAVNGKTIEQIRVLTRYLLVYSFYSLSIIGKIEDVPSFHYYSPLINGLITALKLMLPLLMIQCIISANTEVAWTNRVQIFHELLAMCNGIALILLFRVRNHDCTLNEMYMRIIQFVIVQVLPFVLLIITYMAHYILERNNKQLDLLRL